MKVRGFSASSRQVAINQLGTRLAKPNSTDDGNGSFADLGWQVAVNRLRTRLDDANGRFSDLDKLQ